MDEFGTHQPVLQFLASKFKIKHVLEFGCGEYSTSLFLTQFPDLKSLLSIETDKDWAAKVKEKHSKDKRLELRLVEDSIATVHSLELNKFGLIFVDNTMDAKIREATIRAVATQNIGNAWVVIHDFDYMPYQKAAQTLQHIVVYTSLVPHTAVCWNDKL